MQFRRLPLEAEVRELPSVALARVQVWLGKGVRSLGGVANLAQRDLSTQENFVSDGDGREQGAREKTFSECHGQVKAADLDGII